MDPRLIDHVRQLLAGAAPAEVAAFDHDLRQARRTAGGDLAHPAVRETVLRWASQATLHAVPLTANERAVLERFRAGNVSGPRVLGDDGTSRPL